MELPALAGCQRGLAVMAQARPWMWLTDRAQMGGEPSREALLLRASASGNVCLGSGPAEVTTAGLPGQLGAVGTHPLTEPHSQLSNGPGRGGRTAGPSPRGWRALPVAAPAPEPGLPGCRQAWRVLRSASCPGCNTAAPNTGPGGTLT